MKSIKHFAFAILISSLSGTTLAGEFAYTCEVSHVYFEKVNGSLKAYPNSELEKLVKKSSFSVSRETGSLTGNSTSLDTSLAKSTQVINSGSKENYFVAVADFGVFENGTHPYQLLKIMEFQPGAMKPFFLMGDLGIVTGICK